MKHVSRKWGEAIRVQEPLDPSINNLNRDYLPTTRHNRLFQSNFLLKEVKKMTSLFNEFKAGVIHRVLLFVLTVVFLSVVLPPDALARPTDKTLPNPYIQSRGDDEIVAGIKFKDLLGLGCTGEDVSYDDGHKKVEDSFIKKEDKRHRPIRVDFVNWYILYRLLLGR